MSNQCKECKAYNGHAPNCSLMSEEYARSELKRYAKAYSELAGEYYKLYQQRGEHYNAGMRRLREEIERWKGKFLIVKHENNQLRKKK